MVPNIKIFGCKYSVPWVILIILQLTALFLLIATYTTDNWVYGDKIKSSLLYLTYHSQSINIYKETGKVCLNDSNTEKCRLLLGLLSGLYTYTLLSFLSIISIVVWIISAVLLSLKRNSFVFGGFFAFLSLIFYIFSVASWVLCIGVRTQTCKINGDSENSAYLCFGDGFKLNLFVIGLILSVLYFFFLVGGISLKKLDFNYMKIQEESRPTNLELTHLGTCERSAITN